MNKKEQIQYAVEQFIEQGNIHIVDEIFSTNYIAHAENKEHKGREFLRQFSKQLQTSIPDIHVLKIEILLEEKNKISWQRTLQGTHKKNMMGIPPSHKTIHWNEMILSRFEGDQIVEEWIVSELMGQLLLKSPKIPSPDDPK